MSANTFALAVSEFEAAVKAHDISYSYSDDHRVWTRGCKSEDAVNLAAKKVRDIAKVDKMLLSELNGLKLSEYVENELEKIWNEAVQAQFTESAWDTFKWQRKA